MLLKPAVLREGDYIGIVAPAGPLFDPRLVRRGQQVLETFGFKVVLGKTVEKNIGYLAGTDQERLDDLMGMFAKENIKAIICARGGYGCMRLLNGLDFSLIRRNPKIFVGYSDVTALHLALLQKAGLVSFHGPMLVDLAANFSDYSRSSLLQALTAAVPLGFVRSAANGPRLQTICGGQATGSLVGGNLSLIVAGLGTPYEINTEGKILFFEEVGEEPYRIDRMLMQLKLSGKLKQAAGIVIGECVGCGSGSEGLSADTVGLEEVFNDYFATLGLPCIYGLTIGHGCCRATIPYGVLAVLDAERQRLEITEVATTK